MADATATPATLPVVASTPAAGAGQGAGPSTINLGLSVQVSGASADTATNGTRGTNPIPVVATFNPVTIDITEFIVSGTIKFDITIDPDITAQLLGYQKYAVDGRPPEYRAVAVTPGGTPKAEFDLAIIEQIEWTLNGAGGATFTLPVNDPKITHMTVPDTEVQVWRGPDLLAQGPAVRAAGDDKQVQFQVAGLPWYFTKRHVGAPEENYVPNGSFEEDLDQWTVTWNAYEPGPNRNSDYFTVEIRQDRFIEGQKSLYMKGDGRMYFGPAVATNGFFWNASNAKGEQWYLVAWCYIPSNEWVSPRIVSDGIINFGAGIILQRFSTTETIVVTGVPGVADVVSPRPIENVYLPIDDSIPKDQWVRMEVPFTQPVTGETEIIGLQCYAPIGAIYWDQISLVRKEGLYFNNVDQATIIQGLVEHAQDPAFGKSDLRIETNCPPTGVLRTREYEFFNRQLISDTIDEWPQLWDGMDWSIDITPTTRVFRSHYPRRGATKQRYALVFGKNIARLKMAVDGEETANSVLVMADLGEGAAREEGFAIAADTLADGLVLEKVYTATPGSSINTLNAQARRGVRRYQNPVTLPTLELFQTATQELLGVLVPGDVVPVYVNYGWYQLDGLYRITRIVLDPRTEVMSVDINPEVDWSLTDG